MPETNSKCAFITFVGAPNVGKSTLTNLLVGTKVSIVTPKVQTTRTRVMGIAIFNEAQIIIIDTPGIFKPKKTLDKAMVKAAWGGLKDSDFMCLLVDAKRGLCSDTRDIIRGIKQRDGKKILLINKVDLVKKEELLDLSANLHEACDFDKVFMISALKNKGVDDFSNYLEENAPDGDWMYPEDQVSDMPLRLFAAEITREKLMLALDQELPYELMVETESWQDNPKRKSVKINQIIYVTSENHKKIVIGKGGQNIKTVGEKSRKELEYHLSQKVHLFLFVKVKENWMNNKENYNIMGLEL